MLKRLKTHHLYRHATAATVRLPLHFRQTLDPRGKARKAEEEEGDRLLGGLGVEIIEEGKLHFSSAVSLTSGPTRTS